MNPILTMDFETDPFAHKRDVKPFACGLYDGKDFASIWSSKCAEKMVEHLERLEPSIIYMHNGGKFDIFFLMRWLHDDMMIINGRIVKARLGPHEIRDSFAILPMALKHYKKIDIDITKLERGNREANRAEILEYLRGDCVYLWELVTGFREELGDYLTVGSAAMAQLLKHHPFPRGNSYHDVTFRKRFFFGGRVQCLESGIIDRSLKVYDVNSMYPYVMKNFRHPVSTQSSVSREITKDTGFLIAEGRNVGPYGCFPTRNRKGGIDFTSEQGEFMMSIHEWQAAEELRWFRPTRVIKAFQFDDWDCFDGFVDHFYNARLKAKKNSDRMREIFYKFVLNSAYGKFAQNPEHFSDHVITHGVRLPEPWQEKYVYNEGDYVIWTKSVTRHTYYNVCIGASITGAARAVLLRGLASSRKPVYCDTDSIIASDLFTSHDAKELGAWKLEATGDRIAIAGKKLYAMWDKKDVVKIASKGSKISADDILAVARGGVKMYRKDAPTFKLGGETQWIERKIRRTVL